MHINNTSKYYEESDPSLFYEMTVCQCLSSKESPYMEALFIKKTFGELFFEFLEKKIDSIDILVECGGGYGTLMKELLLFLKPRKVIMVDISKKFLEIQRKTLENFPNVEYVNDDIFNFLNNMSGKIDLFIANEVMGDLETMVNVNKNDFNNVYGVDISYLPQIFNYNSGAVKLIEKLKNRAKAAFLSEHSSTYEVPDNFRDFLFNENKTLSPRKISLKGHDEYSINFKMLSEISKKMGFQVIRKHFIDFLPLRNDKLIRFVLSSNSHQTESHEIIYEFYNHVKEYEFLFLVEQ